MKITKLRLLVVLVGGLALLNWGFVLFSGITFVDYVKNVVFIYELEKEAYNGNEGAGKLLDTIRDPEAAMRNMDEESYQKMKDDAKAGTAEEQFTVGVAAYIRQDYTGAVIWLTKAANRGYLIAQHFLGKLYFEGKVVEQDYDKAFKLLTPAADAGHAQAQSMLGIMYANGFGVEKN